MENNMQNNLNVVTGTLVRGVLVGTKQNKNVWTDKQSQKQESTYNVIGIETSFLNGFNQEQTRIIEVRISTAKEKDSAFMKSLNDNHMAVVELPVILGDYRSVYTDSNAILTVLTPALEKVN